MNGVTRAFIAAIVASLTLVGCTAKRPGEEVSSAAAVPRKPAASVTFPTHPSTTGPGQYEAKTSGASCVLQVPTSPKDSRVHEIEKMRKNLDLQPFTYVVAACDNRRGSAALDLEGGVLVAPKHGEQTNLDSFDNPDGVFEEFANDDKSIPLYNRYLGSDFIQPGVKSAVVFAAHEPITGVQRVFISMDGTTFIPARKVQ